jgi:CTP:molybdopterin cytidylyltransferase MocA
VHFVTNRGWRSGMLSSARLGLRVALRLRPEQVLVLPVDHPNVKTATVRTLAEAMRAALSSYEGAGRRKTRARGNGFAYAWCRATGAAAGIRCHSRRPSRARWRRRRCRGSQRRVRRNARIVGYLDCPTPASCATAIRAGRDDSLNHGDPSVVVRLPPDSRRR